MGQCINIFFKKLNRFSQTSFFFFFSNKKSITKIMNILFILFHNKKMKKS